MATGHECISLIDMFLDGSMAVDEFEERYLRCFKELPLMDAPLFNALERAFLALDAYVPSVSQLEESPLRLSYASLVRETQSAREEIAKLQGR